MIKKAKKNKQFKVTPSVFDRKNIFKTMCLKLAKDKKDPLYAKLLIARELQNKDKEFDNDSLKKIRDICNEYIQE